MLAAEYAITLEQGASFSQVWKWTDKSGAAVDLTDLDLKCQLKLGRTGIVLLEGSYVGSTNTPSGDMVLSEGGTAGTFGLSISRSVTASLYFINAFWYLEIANVLNTFRILEGPVTLSRR